MSRETMLDDALGVLLADPLADVVDLALCARDGLVEAHARGGSVAFDGGGTVAWVRGANPLGRQDVSAFSPLEAEVASARPANDRNHYPHAYTNAAQLFADPRAPDIAVVHSPAHNWEERGGHRGEHGSLDLVQSRAPLVLAGRGVRRLGSLAAAARIVDVGPTLASLLGVPPAGGRLLAAQEGRVLDEASGGAAGRVLAILCDGTNANVLYAMAAAGELPNVAGLMGEGTTFLHGCIAAFPSVTLANHASAATGASPGRHGILSNFYFDRATGRRIVANAPETWHRARDELRPDVETIFEAAARARKHAAAVNEPADRGAGSSTFDVLRSGQVGTGSLASLLPDPESVPHTTPAFVRASREYGWATSADHLAVVQTEALCASARPPDLLWVNLILPDAANHAGGPYSEIARAGMRDTDARIGRVLAAAGWDGDETAVVLFADHGMEETDPTCKGDFDEALRRAKIPFRDEGYGFLYLGV